MMETVVDPHSRDIVKFDGPTGAQCPAHAKGITFLKAVLDFCRKLDIRDGVREGG